MAKNADDGTMGGSNTRVTSEEHQAEKFKHCVGVGEDGGKGVGVLFPGGASCRGTRF